MPCCSQRSDIQGMSLCSIVPRLKHGLVVLDRADADLKLLSSKQLPKDAFKDKVVWITGASQVHTRDLQAWPRPHTFQCAAHCMREHINYPPPLSGLD